MALGVRKRRSRKSNMEFWVFRHLEVALELWTHGCMGIENEGTRRWKDWSVYEYLNEAQISYRHDILFLMKYAYLLQNIPSHSALHFCKYFFCEDRDRAGIPHVHGSPCPKGPISKKKQVIVRFHRYHTITSRQNLEKDHDIKV